MKKDWLCRGSYDEKNQEIAPVMMSQWWSRSSDDLDPVMMIQQWWSRSINDPDLVMMPSDDPDLVMMPSDDPDRVMIQIRWWRWLEDEDELKMKNTWRWRGLEDDPEDKEKKTCGENCVERIPS